MVPKTLPSSRGTIHAGDVLAGRYQLHTLIGEGGMGSVYLAHDTQLDRSVAVKLLAPGLVHDAEVLERFEREARLTAKLDHPHIVPIYDVGQHQGQPFIVMKLLKGESLAERLKKKGGLGAEESFKILSQVADGLDYIHGQGLIHRDIKAGNILVSPEGQATILDFGILREKAGTKGLTRAGLVMGTPQYMAPEQAMGMTDVDHRVDLYALAVVLFECLTGTLPFEADSELKLIQMQAHAPVPELVDRAPWISHAVAAVVKKALAKKPSERFETARAMMEALEGAQRSSARQPASKNRAAVPDTKESLRALQDNSRPRWIAVMSVVLLGVVGVWWWLGNEAVPDSPPAIAAPIPVPEPDAGAEEVASPEPVVTPPIEPEAAPTAMPRESHDAGVESTASSASTTRKPKRMGRLNLVTTFDNEPFWAQVTVDGVPRGRTPMLLELPVGKHTLEVERSGFETRTQSIRISAERPLVLKIELVPKRH